MMKPDFKIIDRMKDLFLKFCRWVLAAMGLASVASCDENGWTGDIKCEYGTPHCSFEVKCRVVDSRTGIPVKGVRMTPGYRYKYENQQGEVIEKFYNINEGTVVENGECGLSGTKSLGNLDLDEIHLLLTDPDPDADGHYKDSIYVVKMDKIKDKDPKDFWNTGTYGAYVTLKADEVAKTE